MKNEFTSPAYPCMPLQDKFGQLVVPVAGMSKLDHFTLQIFIHKAESIEKSIETAMELLTALETKTKTLQNEKPNNLSIIK
jgi:hypothetical protein